MRRAMTGIIGALILTIAIYFALFWGYDALRILTSPTYGLEDVWRSQVVFGLGRFAGLEPHGLLRLAAVLGALKLTVAGVCAVHVLDRLRSLVSGTASNEILETGLMLAVAITIVSVVPAILSQNGDLVREQLLQLFLAGLAGALAVFERSHRAPDAPAAEPEEPVLAADVTPFSPLRR